MTENLVSKEIHISEKVGEILVPVDASRPKVGVPLIAKQLAMKYLNTVDRPRRVISEIYEAGVAIEVGVVIQIKAGKQKLKDYIHLMHEEDTYHTMMKLKQEGDGGIAIT